MARQQALASERTPRRTARLARALALAAGLLVVASAAHAVAIPVSATLSHPISTGWTTYSCGAFLLFTCVEPTVDHDLSILFSDASTVVLRAYVQTDDVLSSIIPVRVRFEDLSLTGVGLTALSSLFAPYSQTDYGQLILAGGDTLLEDFDLTPFEPPHYRFTDSTGATHLLLGDGRGRFFNPIPEAATAMLVTAGLAALALARRRDPSS